MSVERQFTKGVAWMAAGNWTEQAVNFVLFVLLARLLGAEVFGLAAMAAAFVLLSEFLVRESLSEILIAKDAPEPGHFNAAFWLLSGLGALLTLALVLCSGLIGAFYGHPVVGNLMIGFSPTVLLIAFTAVPVAILRRALKFKVLSLRALAGVVVGGIVGLGMAWAGYGAWALVGQRLAQVGTNVVMAWGAVDWRPSMGFERRHARDVLGFGSKVLGLRAAELVSTQTPIIIIGRTLGAASLGQFAIAWRLIEIGSFLIVTPLRMVAQPAFAAITRAGENPAKLLGDIGRISSLAAFPAFVGLAVLATPAVRVLFGQGWGDAAGVLNILALVGIYFCIEKVQQAFCLAAGQAGRLTALAWVEALVGVVIIWAASGWGLAGVSAAFVLRYLLLWPFRFRIVAAIGSTSITALAGVFVLPAMLSAAMGGAVWAVLQAASGANAPVLVILGALTGLVVFSLGTLLIMRDRIALARRYLAGTTGV